MSEVLRGLTVGLVLSAGTSIGAQSPARPVEPASVQVRQQIAALEGALENAVRQGTVMLNQRLQTSNTDNMVMLAGLTRARGFRLDDYGVVFDVEFPSMRRSMVWSMQTLEGGRAVRAAADAPSTTVRPREIYQTEIADALVNAILDYKGSVGVGANEWLTVAARESVIDRRIVPGDPSDTAITVILRIKGSDLQALREGTLSREDARKRVDLKQY
ncbi:MAG: hypothetical protein ABIS29_18025 [Vicinamibacterales bacterium]